MIYIHKGQEPGGLIQYRYQENHRFDDLKAEVKEELRNSLLKEQGYLCAYCMCRINDARDVKLEHFEARTPENELRYHNLLAVCKGGEGQPSRVQHCDTKKGNRPLFISPLNKSDMERIYYSNSGEVHSLDTQQYEYEYRTANGQIHKGITSQDRDLVECLNLNYENGAPLRGRRDALRKFQSRLHQYTDKKSKKQFLEKMQAHYRKRDGKLQPYVGILLWYIEKKLRQCR